MCNLYQIEHFLEIDRTAKSQLSEYRDRAPLQMIYVILIVFSGNLADFVFVFSLFFKWVKKFGMWISFIVDERLVFLDKAICYEFNVLLFSVIIETKELSSSGAWYHYSCCNIIKLPVIIYL